MTPTNPIDPVLSTKTVVSQNDATWIPLGPTPLSDVTIEPAFAEEFSTRAQVAALLTRMQECGFDVSQLQLGESSDNWNYPPIKKIIYLTTTGPKLFTLKGQITLKDDGTVTYIDINVGAFINKQHIDGVDQPPAKENGDFIRLLMVNPFFPWLYWSNI